MSSFKFNAAAKPFVFPATPTPTKIFTPTVVTPPSTTVITDDNDPAPTPASSSSTPIPYRSDDREMEDDGQEVIIDGEGEGGYTNPDNIYPYMASPYQTNGTSNDNNTNNNYNGYMMNSPYGYASPYAGGYDPATGMYIYGGYPMAYGIPMANIDDGENSDEEEEEDGEKPAPSPISHRYSIEELLKMQSSSLDLPPPSLPSHLSHLLRPSPSLINPPTPQHHPHPPPSAKASGKKGKKKHKGGGGDDRTRLIAASAPTTPADRHTPPVRHAGSSSRQLFSVKRPATPNTVVGPRWRSPKTTEARDALVFTMRSVLNKLAPHTFERLLKQFLMAVQQIGAGKEALDGAVEILFEKAIMEPHFIPLYAAFTAKLCDSLPSIQPEKDDDDDDNSAEGEEDGDVPKIEESFRTLLLKRSYNLLMAERPSPSCSSSMLSPAPTPTNGKDHSSPSSPSSNERRGSEEKELNDPVEIFRKRSKGNLLFLGELFKEGVLARSVLHLCIERLFDDDDIESLTALLTAAGPRLDDAEGKIALDGHFKRITLLSQDRRFNSRLRFMLMDLIDLRKRKWIHRREEANQSQKLAETAEQKLLNNHHNNHNKTPSKSNGSHEKYVAVTPTHGSTVLNRSLSAPRVTSPVPHSSRSPSPHLPPTPSSISSLPPSLPRHPGPPTNPKTPALKRTESERHPLPSPSHPHAAPERKSIDNAEIRRRVKLFIEEYFSSHDEEEASLCLSELKQSVDGFPLIDPADQTVATALLIVAEGQKYIEKIHSLLQYLFEKKQLSSSSFTNGAAEAMKTLPDLAIDAPRATSQFSSMIAQLVHSGIIEANHILSWLHQIENQYKNRSSDENELSEERESFITCSLSVVLDMFFHLKAFNQKAALDLFGGLLANNSLIAFWQTLQPEADTDMIMGEFEERGMTDLVKECKTKLSA